MRLAKILDALSRGCIHSLESCLFYQWPQIKYLKRSYFRRPAFDPPSTRHKNRNYWLERYQTHRQGVGKPSLQKWTVKENSHE